MSATKLVIIESPAKAATIEGYLGPGCHATASIDHTRDLPQPSELPKDMEKEPFGRFAVNMDDGFASYYVANPDKKKRVTGLKKLLKEYDGLYLATGEGREDEAITWHLLQVLKPRVPVRRMVFHEITKRAIQRVLENTRDLDTALVGAQETHRILDRLYDYEVLPLLRRKIRPSLSAGCVQSAATRLVVAREREYMAHVNTQYWSVDMAFMSTGQAFGARVSSVDSHSIATGSDLSEKDELGTKALKAGVLHLDQVTAHVYAQVLSDAPVSVVNLVTRKPYRRRLTVPPTASALQQEASCKLHWNASSVMYTAQPLHKSGYTTYMRTDSTVSFDRATHVAREQTTQLYGAGAVAKSPRLYGTTSKGTQEAHEVIHPAGDYPRTPGEVAGSPSKQQLALYDLIRKRTVASQMTDVLSYTATIHVLTGIKVDGKRHDVLSSASGTVITPPDFHLAYQEGRDQGCYDAEKNDTEETLSDVAEGDPATLTEAAPDGHETQPPGRYTETALVKTMGEPGIGHPPIYAAIVQTTGDREYVTHHGQYLAPTWLAFSVMRLFEENLTSLTNYDFTASMESNLDRIVAGEENGTEFLTGLFFGPDDTSENSDLRHDVAFLGDGINTYAINSIDLGHGTTLRVERYSPCMEKTSGMHADVPPETAPDELTDELVDQLSSHAADDGRKLGVDPATDHTIVVKDGRYSPYITEVLPEVAEGGKEDTKKMRKAAAKPRTVSLFKTMDITTATLEDALVLLSPPCEVDIGPVLGETITVQNERYGPYLKKGTDSCTLAFEDQLLTITLDETLAIYAQPKACGRGTVRPPLRRFGKDLISGKKVTVKSGRFGLYMTGDETNVMVPRAKTVGDLMAERTYEFLTDKRAKGSAPERTRKTTAKETTIKKTATKKTPVRETATRKATTKGDS